MKKSASILEFFSTVNLFHIESLNIHLIGCKKQSLDLAWARWATVLHWSLWAACFLQYSTYATTVSVASDQNQMLLRQRQNIYMRIISFIVQLIQWDLDIQLLKYFTARMLRCFTQMKEFILPEMWLVAPFIDKGKNKRFDAFVILIWDLTYIRTDFFRERSSAVSWPSGLGVCYQIGHLFESQIVLLVIMPDLMWFYDTSSSIVMIAIPPSCTSTRPQRICDLPHQLNSCMGHTIRRIGN